MLHLHRSLAVAALGAVALVAACGKSEAPPPPKVEAVAAPTVNEEMKRLATEVYVYAYPLVLMDVTKQVQTAKVAVNTLQSRRALSDIAVTEIHPNPDMLYSTAWLDLAREPVVMSVPDTRGRYYVMQLLDAWSNVFQSTGKRTTGTKKGDFAIVGPKWKGELPGDIEEIRAPTEMVWLIGRTQTNGKADDAAAKIQDQYKLTPLSRWHKAGAAPAHAPVAVAGDVRAAPAEQVAKMDAPTFFTRFAALLPGNPPAKEDARVVDKIKALGIVAGQPFTLGKLDAASAKGVEDGAKAALAAIVAAAGGSMGDLRNGWTIQWDLGRYGTNYGLRAVTAWAGLGANAPEDAILSSTHLDAKGRPLNGANKYVLHFDKGKTPPTEGFWSLALYDEKGALVANPIDRHAIGDRDRLKSGPDGSVDLYLQSENPGPDRESNWLPAPRGNFTLILRVYWPKQDMLDRNWSPQAVRPVA